MDNSLNIGELFLKYGSDKHSHGYSDFYQNYLPKNPKSILEIGVKNGASIRAWKEYFPEATIHGLDLFMEFHVPEIPGVKFHAGNQCDWRLLEELRKEDFDVIIDDGSHNSRDQMMTFFGLFNGKHYFIEDLHCCQDEFYRQGLIEKYTAGYLFINLLRTNRYEHDIAFTTKNIIRIKNVCHVDPL